MNRKTLKIAIIGSRGLPVVYGGIERHVEEIGRRFVERGHDVTVFGRKPFSRNGTFNGIEVRVLPSIQTKNLGTASNALAASIRVLFNAFDVVHYHGIGPSIFSWIPSVLGKKTVATIHAQDYRQRKWGVFAKALLKQGERTAVKYCNATISVSKLMAGQLEDKYGKHVHYIPNGATLLDVPRFDRAANLGIEPGRYILTVGRFIVERGFHTLIRAFGEVDTADKLVIVGDTNFDPAYSAELRRLANDRVLFPGYISGPVLNELYAHCNVYVLPSTVEGLPISLIEAMSFSRPVIISDIPENLEVAGGIAATFRREDAADLVRVLGDVLDMEEGRRGEMGDRGRTRVEEQYNWDAVTDRLEELYRHIVP